MKGPKMNLTVENWIALRGVIIAAIGELVTRVDGLDDPAQTITEITRAIDALAMLEHPLQHAGTLQ
jgi:hypothetical protein